MSINWRVAIVLVFILSSCAGQNPPVTSTLEENSTTSVPSATLYSQPLPFFTTPQTSLESTPAIEDSIPITGETPTPNTDTGIIPESGSGAIPLPANNVKPDKFQNFEIPVIGGDGGQVQLLPTTGFPPGVITGIRLGTPLFANMITPRLSIPVLNVNIPIFGIEISNGTWDVSWLQNQAGWLEGTAYPTRDGNSVLTGHVVTADGKNGPFAHLKTLTVDDYVFINYSDFRYIYKVDSINFVKPDDMSVFSHKDDSWITLITCDTYDEKTKEYLFRVVVRAQLLEVQEIK